MPFLQVSIVFKKLFGFGDKKEPRALTSVKQLELRDIITFKHRQILPENLQGSSFEVTNVASYQYDDGFVKELTLSNENNVSYFISLDDTDGDARITLSRKLPRSQVLDLFNEDDFAQLWDPGHCHLTTQKICPELAGWIGNRYHQTVNEGEAYFYNREMQDSSASAYQDDDGEPLRYHECEGSDDHYGLSVEVWTDGTTDVAATIYCPVDIIDTFHPHE